MTIALIGGKIIDGKGGEPLEHGSVVIDGSKIVQVSEQYEFASDVHILDVSGKTVMPSLIDTHVHMAAWAQWLISRQAHPLAYMMSQTVLHLRRALETGVTSARDMGGLEVGFCQAQADGLLRGPRMQTAIVIIQPTNGLTDVRSGLIPTMTPQGLAAFLPGLPTPWADGVDGVRAKVREALRLGADSIKLANSSTPWGNPKLRPDRPLFTRDELEAAVNEAHRAGVLVTCHVMAWDNTEGTLDAIRAGVNLIDHGNLLDDECVEEMAKRGTWYCPMFSVLDFHRTRNPDPAFRATAAKTYDQTAASFRKALEAGVRICMGTDQSYESGWQSYEMWNMVDNGMTPMETILASTAWAAEAMCVDEVVGTLDLGKEADLLVLDGDPLEDIGIFSDPKHLLLVMQAGSAMSGPLARELPYRPPEHLAFTDKGVSKRPW
jgi:imidazolonepropionase-like amidohydrolase